MRFRRYLALVITLSILLSALSNHIFQINATSGNATQPLILVQTVKADTADTLSVKITFKNNPGIVSAKFSVNYPDCLTFTNVKYGKSLSHGLLAYPEKENKNENIKSIILNWVSGTETLSDSEFLYATLTFSLSKSAIIGYNDITVAYNPNDIHNVDMKNITFSVVTAYAITYNLNGGTNNSSNPQIYPSGVSDITLKNPTKKGYTFAGWYDNAKFTGSKATKILKDSIGDKVVYAKWTANKYTLAFSGNGSTSGSTKSITATYDKSVKLTANGFKRKGYTFKCWNTKKDGKGKTYKDKASVKNLTATANGKITLYAQWAKITYKITYKINKGTNSKKNPKTYTVTSAISLKNPTRKGYKFKGWYSDSKYKKKVTKISKGSTGNKTLYAKWAKK